MQKFVKTTCVLAAALMAVYSNATFAAPVAATQADFPLSSTVITFDTIADEAAINSQYVPQGVTFSGALFGMTNSGDTNLFPANGGGTIASNWLYSQGLQGLSFTANFATAVTKVGFYLENWENQLGTVELFSNGLSKGTLAFGPTSSLNASFFGVSEGTGFDTLVFTNTATTNGFYAIDNFTYTSAAAVPEPETYAMLLGGLALMGSIARRRKNRNV